MRSPPPSLLKDPPLQRAVVTGDAVFCQRAIRQHVRDQQGDYLFAVKANQPYLMADLAAAFGNALPPELVNALGEAVPPARTTQPPPDLACARTVEKGHGRIEMYTISVSREYAAHLGWPGAAQVCRIERVRETKDKRSCEITYAVISLSPQQAGPDAPMALWRSNWLIECIFGRIPAGDSGFFRRFGAAG